MRDWTSLVRQRLAREHHTSLPPDVTLEIVQHLEDLYRDAIFQGRTEQDAELAALAQLETADMLAHAVVRRQQTGRSHQPGDLAHSWTGWWRDVSHTLRFLASRPSYSVVIVSTLAVGIGACTAVFSLFNALLLGPLPYPQQDRLVLVWESNAADPANTFIVSAPNYADWVENTESFAALGIWEDITFNVSSSADPEQVAGVRASSSLFAVLGITPARGRTFSPIEERRGDAVAVISDTVWHTQFGASPGAIGQQLRLNGRSHEVIGVLPPGIQFPYKGSGVWIPLGLTQQDQQRGSHSFHVAGRLADGVTFEHASTEMARLGAVLRDRYPDNAGESITITRMRDAGLVNTRRMLLALSGAVGLVLLIACVNVAGLQLALGLTRRREFVTRLALGATYSRLTRQVLVEGGVVAALGCVGGVAIAWVLARAVDLFLSPGSRTLPFRGDVEVTLDATVLVFAASVSAAAALLFAWTPLIGLRRRPLQPMLREGGRGATRFATGTRRLLVTIEIALAVVVLAGAGVMTRSLLRLLAVDPGLDPRAVLTLRVSLPQADTYGATERTTFCTDLRREVGAVAGVISVSAISHLPLSGANAGRGVTIQGRPSPGPNEGASGSYRLVCPDYFATLGIPLLAGRDFSERDARDGEGVVIVNRAFAESYFATGRALGQRMKIGGIESDAPWLTIIGVTEDVRHLALDARPGREIFRPYSQAAWPGLTVVAKTTGPPLQWQTSVRQALRRVEADLPATQVRTMEEVVSRSVAGRETPMRLLAAFALVGLLLVGVGVYGVLAYYVSQRTREFGVRAALGASRTTLVALVLRQSALPLAAGIVVGIAGSIASGRLLSGLLYEVQPGDPWVVALIAVLMVLVAMLSSWLPARRAAGVDPVIALRDE